MSGFNAMSTQTQSHHDSKRKIAGVAGAIIGAGVAIGAAKLLSDKKARRKVMDTLTSVKDSMLDSLETAQEGAKELKNKAQDAIVVDDKKSSPKHPNRTRDEKGHFTKKK
jgi:hypothetical protein